MRKQRIILIGAYGCGNKGDDAILEGILSTLKKNYTFTVIEGNYGGIEEKFKVKTIKCRMNEGMTWAVLGNLLKFFPKYLCECIKSTYILIGGGSLLHDITKYNLLFFSLLQIVAQICGKKVIYIGVGAGPIDTKLGKWLCKYVVGKADKVFVRDIPDYKLLQGIGMKNIKLVADMAFTVKTKKELASEILKLYELKSKQYIVVTACEWFKSDDFWKKEKIDFSRDKNRLAKILEEIMEYTRLPVLFLPTVFHDYKLGKELQIIISKPDFYVLSDNYDCNQMAALVAESKFLFGVRMHSIIFAIRAGVPFLTNIYDRKVESLVNRCGMKKYVFDFYKASTEEILSIVSQILENEKDISEHLRAQTKKLKKEAEIAVKYMKEKSKI